MPTLKELLDTTTAMHRHLCPRQVLGVRMGLYAGELLGLALPQPDKRLYTIMETDGCAADGVAVAVNCWVGRRTMRIEDYGKVAATFVDTQTGQAMRIVPRASVRGDCARLCAPGGQQVGSATHRLPAHAVRGTVRCAGSSAPHPDRADHQPARPQGALRGLRRGDYERARGACAMGWLSAARARETATTISLSPAHCRWQRGR